MPKKNITIFTKNDFPALMNHVYRLRYIIAILVSLILITTGCKKAQEAYVANVFEQYFEQNILNRDFIVNFASDQGNDITTQFNGYIFRLSKNTYYDGPMTATKDGVTTTGTWSSNSDYGKLIINLNQPSTPTEFNFINREWRFTEKALPIMKLAPWGSTAAIELHMERL
jgi:hypothetical protein